VQTEVSVALDTRWEDIDALLQRTKRTTDEELTKAVQEIARQRFEFPTQEHAAYRTYINVPEVVMGVLVGEAEVAPSIVVVERLKTGETELVMTAQVCDVEQVTPAEAQRIWARVAAIPEQAFYLYVPVGYGAAAKRICRSLGIRPEGFRTWRWTPRGFEVNDISEAPSPLAALMPPIVRRLLATP
jgi:hypothetical protein